MMLMPRRGPCSSSRGDSGLSWTHARTVVLLVVLVVRVAWGGGGPDLHRRIGGNGQRHAVPSATFRSCMDVLDSSVPKLDGFFIIDPDGWSGAQMFQVLCRLNSTHANQGTTVIRTVDNINSAVQGNSSVTITYDGVQHENSIRALVDISDRCRQYLQYQCKNAPIWLNGVQQVAWVSWDGRAMPNWGGTETGDNGRCACGLNASCIGGGNCNCDVLSPPGFYEDSGYITDKDTLPVVGLDFNYHGYFGTAFYTVGDLECFGRSSTTTTEAPSTREPPTTPTEPITTERTTTAEPTTHPKLPRTTTEPLMTSESTQPVTTSVTTESIMTSINDVLQTTIPTISEVASTREVTTADQLSTEEAVTSSPPKPPISSFSQDKSDWNDDISDIEDALDEWLEMFDIKPGNTPIESLNNVSMKILDKTFGNLAMQDNPALLTEMALTTLLENNLAKIVGGLRPNDTLEMTVGDARSFSVLVVYRDSSNTSGVANLVQDDSSNGTSYVNSGILTCSVLAQGEPLEIALKFSLRHKPYSPDGKKTVQRLCSFWNNSQRVWSTEGCKTESLDSASTVTTCSCNHNTSFAILLRVADSPVSSEQENADAATTLLSIILGSLSILCLCMGLALYTYLRLFKFLQIKVHANLMGSLLIGQVIFLTGINATEYPIVCKSVTVLVQFFFSGTFCWMLIEGGLLFQRARMVSMQQPKILLLMLIGWGVPFLITMISFAIGFEDYGTKPACWLSTKRGQIWAFVSLVIFVIVVNLGILVMVMRTFMSLKMYTDKENADKIRASFRAMVVLVPILGLTWVFGFLQSTSLAFDFLFVIFNSSQGMLVFICHVVMNSEVQKAFKRRGKNKVSASTASSCDQSDTQMTSRKTNTTSATAF